MSNDALAGAKPAPEAVLLALANPVRWRVVGILAAEGPQSVTAVGARLNRMQHSMSKHMAVLCRAGLVRAVPSPDGDGRKQFYALPPGCRREGPQGPELDFGRCVIRLND